MNLDKNYIRETSFSKSELIKKVKDLFTTSTEIKLSEIPEVLQDDIVSFLDGEELIHDNDGNIIIPLYSYRSWLKKLTRYDNGFDYSIKSLSQI